MPHKRLYFALLDYKTGFHARSQFRCDLISINSN